MNNDFLDEKALLRNKKKFVRKYLSRAWNGEKFSAEEQKQFDRALSMAQSGQVGKWLKLSAYLWVKFMK